MKRSNSDHKLIKMRKKNESHEEVENEVKTDELLNKLHLKLKNIQVIRGQSCGYQYKVSKQSKFISYIQMINN